MNYVIYNAITKFFQQYKFVQTATTKRKNKTKQKQLKKKGKLKKSKGRKPKIFFPNKSNNSPLFWKKWRSKSLQ